MRKPDAFLILRPSILRINKVEHFDHSFYLQWYHRDAWLSALAECGFELRHYYCNRENELWCEDNGLWIAETEKKRIHPTPCP